MTDMVDPVRRSQIMARIRSANTGPERIVRRLLHGLGYRFRLNRADLPGKPDLVLPRHQTVVFVNGCFWHGHTCKDGRRPKSNRAYWNRKLRRNAERDETNARCLRGMGWKQIVVWECECSDADRLERRLEKLLCMR
ncbi:MAG: DNA mismatch endonuclease Vsr [Phycisphaerae bacterium]|nr:DNA mismatch endonuclease Vsr [Phycisphaerae bacterium]